MVKEENNCPYCHLMMVIKREKGKPLVLSKKSRFKHGGEARAFRKWAKQQGYTYAKGDTQELVLIEMFRKAQKGEF